MRISYLADHPEFVPALAPAIWEHWREALPEDTTIEHRIAKLLRHMQKTELPIALVAHQHGDVLGTASLRRHDLEGREDLSPWLEAYSLCTIIAAKVLRQRYAKQSNRRPAAWALNRSTCSRLINNACMNALAGALLNRQHGEVNAATSCSPALRPSLLLSRDDA